MLTRPTTRLALLLFGSGACALIYQVVWLRELRLVFGASTAATAAVLGIFMGGLGLGGALLGRRVDRTENSLAFYSKLELGIAGFAAVTPFFIVVARMAYLASGGLLSLGLVAATLLRLLLSIVVLAVPTFLMGGTLPAVVRAAETDEDLARRNLAFLYGANTLGAVLGAFVSTFWMLETFGTRNTLWLACVVNALIALTALRMSRSLPSRSVAAETTTPVPGDPGSTGTVAPSFIYLAAGVVGLAFLLMEIVWYRMLAAILGGTTYTFGVVLMVALLGIGIGGALYSFGRGAVRPTLSLFALTCALEALLIGLPFAFGDSIAVAAGLQQRWAVHGFQFLVMSWISMAAVVILPSALVAGFQFPLLIGLLGTGRTDVGRHVGTAYAWNTVGAIVGSIAGGFLLLPILTAPGCWRLVIALLGVLAVAGAVISMRQRKRVPTLATTGVLCTAAFVALFSAGPSAVWRHSEIGSRRAQLTGLDQNGLKQWTNAMKRTLVWEAEGREMSVGLRAMDSLSFYVNGKNDGNARRDASTQVGSGMISAALHPEPRDSLVIGLGTGSTAGWLARVATMERVDAVELEPAVLEVARRSGAVNAGLLSNPVANIVLADGREVLLTNQQEYDLIVSEPSNPYRAGIASLYTTEFYRAVAARLRPGGFFTQWVQAYEIDSQTVSTIIATLGTVFPFVQVWQTNGVDIMFVCAEADPGPIEVARLRSRLTEDPFREAFSASWGVHDGEGFLSHFVAESLFTRNFAADESRINTDDRMLVEFGFARAIGRRMGFNIEDLRAEAVAQGLHRPQVSSGEIDWETVDAGRVMMHFLLHGGVPDALKMDPRTEAERHVYQAFLAGDLEELRRVWAAGDVRFQFALQTAVFASALADIGDPETLQLIDRLEPIWPLEARTINARYVWRTGDAPAAVSQLEGVFSEIRANPWVQPLFLVAALDLAREIASNHTEFARPLFDAIQPEFAVAVENERRIQTLFEISLLLGPQATAQVLHDLEPNVPWVHGVLVKRVQVYEAIGDPLAEQARLDLREMTLNGLKN